ncbi:MAG TPA: hypothetical protein VKK61_10820, partial [Tepidisphaeraceae bacterium]|nr:hypothetical protein [Tepidisphaeraceae bacterium]
MPVTLQSVDQKDDLLPLLAMAQPLQAFDQPAPSAPFSSAKPPFRFARAKEKPNTLVSEWITWKADDLTPYLVRSTLGLGSVTWVAQDLGDPTLTRSKSGWVYIWNRIFDWKNSPLVVTSQTPDATKHQYEPGQPMDLGTSVLGTWLELQSKSAWLITLAVLFFIGYWLLAGPGVQVYLAAKKKTQFSWFAFAACALVATSLTLLIVKLVLRGPPELKHFSIVRIAPDQPAMIVSRMGIYIPRDGMQKIELKDVAADHVSSISALPISPTFLKDAPDQTGPEYTVPIIDAASGQAASVSVPYRSTLKKFQATWVGDLPSPVQGAIKLVGMPNFIEGHLTNAGNTPLHEIYFAFNYPGQGALSGDWILYIPTWDAGVTLDLAKEFNKTDDSKTLSPGFNEDNRPDGAHRVRGRISIDWEPYWLSRLGGHNFDETFDDSSEAFRRSLVML